MLEYYNKTDNMNDSQHQLDLTVLYNKIYQIKNQIEKEGNISEQNYKFLNDFLDDVINYSKGEETDNNIVSGSNAYVITLKALNLKLLGSFTDVSKVLEKIKSEAKNVYKGNECDIEMLEEVLGNLCKTIELENEDNNLIQDKNWVKGYHV